MEQVLDQIRATFDCGIWYPVVSSVLMMPDACGAIEFWGQNKTPRDRYIEWYDKWVFPNFNAGRVIFDGSVVYIVRNAMIHESTGFTRGKHGFDRVIFTPPNKTGINIEFAFMRPAEKEGKAALQVTISGLMNAMEDGVRKWLSDVRGDADKRRELAIDNLIQYRPDGHPSYIVGIPIVA